MHLPFYLLDTVLTESADASFRPAAAVCVVWFTCVEYAVLCLLRRPPRLLLPGNTDIDQPNTRPHSLSEDSQ